MSSITSGEPQDSHDVTASPDSLREARRGAETWTVLVIGAGASGTLVAANLLTRGAQDPGLRVVLADPSPGTGEGVAYGTRDERHLLNVRASGMSAWPNDPGDFVKWLARERDIDDPNAFVPRAWYAAYLQETLQRAVSASSAGFRRVHQAVVELQDAAPPADGGLVATLQDGTYVRADAAVLAIGFAAPAPQWAPAALTNSRRYVADPWNVDQLNAATDGAQDAVIVGTGLTMVDIALALADRGIAVQAISRNGLWPRAHDALPAPPVETPAPPTSQADLAEVEGFVRAHVAEAERSGAGWRAGTDALRPITNDLWASMPLDERRRALSSSALRAWEVARHRIAHDVAERFDALVEDGMISVGAGRVADCTTVDDQVELLLADGSRVRTDVVIDCTGPGLSAADAAPRLLARLTDDGLVREHPLGLGVDHLPGGRVCGADSLSQGQPIFVVGPLRRGELWETTAIPELRVQAAQVAEAVLAEAVLADGGSARPA